MKVFKASRYKTAENALKTSCTLLIDNNKVKMQVYFCEFSP